MWLQMKWAGREKVRPALRGTLREAFGGVRREKTRDWVGLWCCVCVLGAPTTSAGACLRRDQAGRTRIHPDAVRRICNDLMPYQKTHDKVLLIHPKVGKTLGYLRCRLNYLGRHCRDSSIWCHGDILEISREKWTQRTSRAAVCVIEGCPRRFKGCTRRNSCRLPMLRPA